VFSAQRNASNDDGDRRRAPGGLLSFEKLVKKGKQYDDKERRERTYKERAKQWKKYQRLLQKEGKIDRNTRVSTSDPTIAQTTDRFGRKIRKRKYKGKRDRGGGDEGGSDKEAQSSDEEYEFEDDDGSERKVSKQSSHRYERFSSRIDDRIDQALREQQELEAKEKEELAKYGLVKEPTRRPKQEGVEEARARRKMDLRELHKVVKQEKKQAEAMQEQKRLEHEKQVQEAKKQRRIQTKRLRERTRKGQPIMKNMMLNVLDKLQKRVGYQPGAAPSSTK